MMSLSEAARATAQSKSTIRRAVKAGRLSATRTDTGEFQVDPAELHQVFPIERHRNASVKRGAVGTLRSEAEMAGLIGMAELLRDELAAVCKDRDAWRSQAERLLLTQSTTTPADLWATALRQSAQRQLRPLRASGQDCFFPAFFKRR